MPTLDAVKALCLESPSSGGTQLDTYPTEVDPSQDALTVAGVYLNGPTAKPADKTVLVDRVNGSLRLTDQQTTHTLGELVSSATGEVGSHNALLDVIHFLAEGPGDGFASGAYCQEQYNGIQLIRATWYATSAMTTPIVSRTYTYNGLQVLQEVMTLYGATGAVVRTVTDSYTYTGIQRTGRTRTWS